MLIPLHLVQTPNMVTVKGSKLLHDVNILYNDDLHILQCVLERHTIGGEGDLHINKVFHLC